MKSKPKKKNTPILDEAPSVHIELLYIKDCPHFKKTKRLIHDTTRSLGLNIPLKKIEIKTEDDVRLYSFPGSPTIRINGEDVEPDTANEEGLVCRVYKDGTGLPENNVLKCKIAKAAGLRTILFVCTGNSVRSKMAEAIANHFFSDKWAAFSAGTIPMKTNDYVIKALQESKIEVNDRKSRHIDVFRNCSFDRIVVLCSDVERMCPNYPYHGQIESIIFHDPLSGYRFGSIQAYIKLREEMKKMIFRYLAEG